MIANGTKFGKLTVTAPVKSTKSGNLRSLCKCDCGTEHTTRNAWLQSGRVTSCRACAQGYGAVATPAFNAANKAIKEGAANRDELIALCCPSDQKLLRGKIGVPNVNTNHELS